MNYPKPFYAGLRFRKPKTGMGKLRKALRAAGFGGVHGAGGLVTTFSKRTASCGVAKKRALRGLAILKKYGASIERWDSGLKMMKRSVKGYSKLVKCPIKRKR